jgi:hypothetical protein
VTLSGGHALGQDDPIYGYSGGEGGAVYLRGGGLSGGELNIRNSTLSGNAAYNGGAIFATFGTTTIRNSVISGNAANSRGGAIYSDYALLSIDGALLNDNTAELAGGAVCGYISEMTIARSVISGNSAEYGGGIITAQYSNTTIDRSTISGNTAAQNGGGVHNELQSAMLIVNSAISGNTAGRDGGGVSNASKTTLGVLNSTLSGNTAARYGGGVDSYGTSLFLADSLISGNVAPDGREVHHDAGVYYYGFVFADVYNVFGFNGDSGVAGFTPSATDVIPAGPLSAILDPVLADNGGPTPTHALVPGSPAIDVAPSAACAAPPIFSLDQRGFPRNVDGDGVPSANECDVGSFEFAAP